VAAAEDAALEWLRLLPVLAAGGEDSPLPALAPTLFQVPLSKIHNAPALVLLLTGILSVFLRACKIRCMWLQVPRVGMPAPAAALASLAVYPFPDAGAATDVLRALAVLAEAAAPLPQVSFAGCLAHACGARP
jgi:hypothetical protein